MEGPRPPKEAELGQIFEFLNHQLRPKATWSIAKEYPTALSPANLGNIRVITEQNEVIAHSVLKPLVVKTPLMILKVAAIGSVVTHPSHRGKGHSQKIIKECLAEAHRQECDLAILWTNLYDFYRKLDFELAGFENSFVIEDEFSVASEGIKFVKGIQVDPQAILKLYSQHTVSSFRTAEDIRKFLSIPQSQVYTAWDANNQLLAFAVEGKGADLTGYIHEWGGSVSKLLALLSYVRKDKKSPITVIVPHHSLNLLAAAKQQHFLLNEGYLGMIKIVQEEALFSKVRKAAKTVGMDNFVLQKDPDGYALGFQGNLLRMKSEKDLVRFLFGPLPETGSDELWQKLERLLPLPLWLWGWDSI